MALDERLGRFTAKQYNPTGIVFQDFLPPLGESNRNNNNINNHAQSVVYRITINGKSVYISSRTWIQPIPRRPGGNLNVARASDAGPEKIYPRNLWKSCFKANPWDGCLVKCFRCGGEPLKGHSTCRNGGRIAAIVLKGKSTAWSWFLQVDEPI